MWDTKTAPLGGSRSAPLVATLFIVGYDLRSATHHLEVRDRRDGGELRAEIDTVYNDIDPGVSLVAFETVEGVPQTTLRIRIAEATMEAMPDAPEPGDDVALTWGMHITPAGGTKFHAFEGPFTVKASTPE